MIQHSRTSRGRTASSLTGRYTASGADSLQTARISVVPELRNTYLKDLGLMAVDDGNGVLVLVDIETGRQYIGQGLLGTLALHLPEQVAEQISAEPPEPQPPERGPRGSGSFRSSAG